MNHTKDCVDIPEHVKIREDENKNMIYPWYKKIVPSTISITFQYKKKLGYYPNLIRPRTYNDKLQWMKLHDKNPFYTTLVDKYKVKEYVSKIIGSKYIIPTIGVWENPDDIDFASLPSKFILKTTHDSGGSIICRNKNEFDVHGAKERLRQSVIQNYFWIAREWPYKNVKPRIIAEALLENDSMSCPSYEEALYAENPSLDELMNDSSAKRLSFYCYKGKVKVFRYGSHNLWDTEMFLSVSDDVLILEQQNKAVQDISGSISRMIGICEKLSEAHLYMEVILFLKEGKIFFGNISIPDFYSQNATGKSDTYEMQLMKWISCKNTNNIY